MKVLLHIERLVLDGLDLPHGHPARLRSALEGELARLMRVPQRRPLEGGAMPQLRMSDVATRRGDSPEAIGKRVARAVHRGLGAQR